MATNVYIRGRRVWSSQPNTMQLRAVAGVMSMPISRESMPEPEPPPPDAPRLAEVDGPMHVDAEDGIAYRKVGGGLDKVVTIAKGWNTTATWCKQLTCTMKQLALLVQLGCFDAAIERGTMHRCLRALDIAKAKKLLLEWAGTTPAPKKVRRI